MPAHLIPRCPVLRPIFWASAELKLGPDDDDNTGHTVWCDGRVHHAGFTTTFVPNTVVPYVVDGNILRH